MRHFVRRKKNKAQNENPIEGKARLDRKTKNLVKRLKPGEIAIIDHRDIDRVSASSIIERNPIAVINASSFITGTYPNIGPLMMLASQIKLIEEVGEDIFDRVHEGDVLKIAGPDIYMDQEKIASGMELCQEEAKRRIEESRKNMGKRLEDFARNTLELLDKEKEILLEEIALPDIKTDFSGRHALVVVRGHGYKEDLRSLKPYIREMRPVLVAVDGGADALLEMGYKPNLTVGDMDSVTDDALKVSHEVVLHAYPDGRAPGKERLEKLGIEYEVFPYFGTSEDIAVLIPFEKGAELITVVGGHTNLIDFLDKDRKGMSSTFLARLRIGSILVDAKGVSELYQPRVKTWHFLLMFVVALVVITLVIVLSEPVRQFITVLAMRFQIYLMRLQHLI
ncbi:MAG: putative cytokinetic ring protein SteA [Actinomycetota bacterium]|nr:putative cytokinetic ring protein SteA [Actinomycetota bacterium]